MSTIEQTSSWDLRTLYADDRDPRLNQDLLLVKRSVDDFVAAWKDRTDELGDPVVLASALFGFAVIRQRVVAAPLYGAPIMLPGYYWRLRAVADQRAAFIVHTAWLYGQYAIEREKDLAFFLKAMGSMPLATQERLLAAPELAPYHDWLKWRFRLGPHLLPAGAICDPAEPFAATQQALAGEWACVQTEAGGAYTHVPFYALAALCASSQPSVRHGAVELTNDVLAAMAPAAAGELSQVMRDRWEAATLKGLAHPEAARLREDGVAEASVDELLRAVQEHFPLAHEFYQFKAQLLGVDQLPYGERMCLCDNAPGPYTLAEACAVVRAALGRLDPWFVAQFDDALAKGHIDASARAGKAGGSECAGPFQRSGVFLRIVFTGSLLDVVALGREFGRYLHCKLMQANCEPLVYGAPAPVAELVAAFFESFVFFELLKQTQDPRARLALQVARLDVSAAAIFGQAASVLAERELYAAVAAEGSLTPDTIGAIFTRHASTYLGDAVVMKPGSENWWVPMEEPRSGFGSYGYSLGALLASLLRTRVVADHGAMKQVKELMSTGLRVSPPELLAAVGFDISGPEVWVSAFKQWRAELHIAKALARSLGKL